eukprot:CAMPEP_0197038604 /NCGR_PEP_ID=MMETSP1384-20130603/15516_1 /TAXON_ID=29189 /ORGANISM="Ammonia sp." /LENGTH=337 /DNA_ID=CAMNT_0042469061 /DNA_START=31 /DNA_END=1044 /DNA_ORIENTATION=-
MSQSCDKHDKKVVHILNKVGVIDARKLTQTLQGSIWKASLVSTNGDNDSDAPKAVAVKVTDRYLQEHGLARIGDQTYCVQEDIVYEAKLLQSVTASKQCPDSIVKFHRFFATKTDYYLIMEDGGSSLFDFVVKAHRFIRAGTIGLSHWKQMVKRIFKQMVECVEYLHAHNIVHLDISLENFLINDVAVESFVKDKQEYIEFIVDDVQIKLCDFGLAEKFADSNKQCLCSKWVGKTNYKSPEVVAKKTNFSAKKNDIWCLGMCLFMLSVGSAPWNAADPSDHVYVHMTNGSMKQLLKSWNVPRFVHTELLDLFSGIFQCEGKRIGLDAIKMHAFFLHE